MCFQACHTKYRESEGKVLPTPKSVAVENPNDNKILKDSFNSEDHLTATVLWAVEILCELCPTDTWTSYPNTCSYSRFPLTAC